MNRKWTIYQIITLMALVICFILLHLFMDYKPVQPNETGSMFMLGIFLYIPVSWIYLTIYFQHKKNPEMLKHRLWRVLPVVLISVSFISLIVFIMLVTMGPFMDWFEQGSWILYFFITYAAILYFLFIMSIVYRMSADKRNIIHHSYVWSVVMLVAISFVF